MTDEYYAIWSPDVGSYTSLLIDDREAVEFFADYGGEWCLMQENGWRCDKVRIERVEND